MKERENKKGSAWSYFRFSLYAFLGICMEGILLGVEYTIHGKEFSEFSMLESIVHCIITCITWGCFTYALYQASKKEGYDFMKKTAISNKKGLIIAMKEKIY